MSYLVDDLSPARTEPLRLPAPPVPRAPSPFPFVAAFVPLLAAGGMWAVTGSIMMLWFAALTPAMLLGSLWDRRRGQRAQAKAFDGELTRALADARTEIAARHTAEVQARARVHPDLVGLCADVVNVWRAHPQREGVVRVGSGAVAISPHVDALGDDPRVAAVIAESAQLADAPIVIPLDGGICVRGPLVSRLAVVRAMVLQLCVVHSPSLWHIVRTDEEWMRTLPHTAPVVGARTLGVTGAAESIADVTICHVPGGAPVPAGVATVIDLYAGTRGQLTRGSRTLDLNFDACSAPQATELATALGQRAQAMQAETAEPIRASELSAERRGTLGVCLGRTAGADELYVDIAEDGPHALVVGTTGAGKSELLVTWATALCRAYSPEQVMLLLADFKGGTAFEPLAALPHVAGVITDLDGALATRAVHSLAAEVRRREGRLAAAGARDIADPRVRMPRLVVFVDEFPALMSQQPHLEPVFADIAARGRALGIHLVIGGQRTLGVVREGIASNCGLRIALRVSDAQESRNVIGTEDAARLRGDAASRGWALVKRTADNAAGRIRVGLTTPADIDAVIARGESASIEPRPWLPPLPAHVQGSELSDPAIIGLADDPESSSQPYVRRNPDERSITIIGAAKSGKTAAARAFAAHDPDGVWCVPDPERAWDQLADAGEQPPRTFVIDDLDALMSQFPEPWAGEFLSRLDALITRAAYTDTTVILTAQRPAGASARVLQATSRRVLLAMASRADHLAAGGDARDYDPRRGAGRTSLNGLETQLVWTPERHGTELAPLPRWRPSAGPVGVVSRAGISRLQRLAERWGRTLCQVSDLMTGVEIMSLETAVIVGDPEQWQRAWASAETIRREGQFLIGAECGSDVRILTGERSVPPFARPGRAWLMRPGYGLERVVWE